MTASSSYMRYDSPYPLYGIGFSNNPARPHRTALTTLLTGPSNKLVILDPSPSQPSGYAAQADFQQIASANLPFPATKVGWEPGGDGVGGAGRGEHLATTGDVLRIWTVSESWEGDDRGRGGYPGRNGWDNGGGGSGGSVLETRSVLTNSKSPQMALPPLTSFSWNPISSNSIVTCSIDTTATLWDINTSQAITQLIAHDRAVYDLSWLPQSTDIFVSVGADGSLRAFDLRQLEHSTILYESSEATPLARIAFSNKEQHMLACFGLDDSKVLILDMRSPGQPVAELIGHQGALGALAWGAGGNVEGSSGGWIASCGDDCQLLLYDLTNPLPEPTSRPASRAKPKATSPNPYALSPPATPASNAARTPSPSQAVEVLPSKAWTAESEVNNLAFTATGDWVGCVSGQRMSVLRV